MKILIVGFAAFVVWSIPSTYYYVCKINELCPEESPEVVAEEVPIVEPIAPEEDYTEMIVEEEPAEVPPPPPFTLHHEFNVAAFITDPQYSDYFNELQHYLQEHSEATILITGNTDSKGSDQYNRELGEERADYVSNDLVKKGLSASSMQTKSLGESNPIADNSTEEGRAQNRRTTIEIETNN